MLDLKDNNMKNQMKKQENLKEVCEKLGYKVYATDDVIKNTPQRQKGDIEIFTIGRYISNDDLAREYRSRGFAPTDPFTLADYCKDLDKDIATQWKDANGKWCYAAFGRWDGEREVYVDRHGYDWHDRWCFAGLRKSALRNLVPKNSLDTLSLEKRVVALEEKMDKLGELLGEVEKWLIKK